MLYQQIKTINAILCVLSLALTITLFNTKKIYQLSFITGCLFIMFFFFDCILF